MKYIINGKKYDTETAEEMASWSNNRSCMDFHWCDETLYRKRTGEFFLYGRGGAMTNYAEPCGDGRGSGERIIPMTEAEARAWAEGHVDGDTYEGIFGEVAEDDSRISVTFTASAEAWESARQAANCLGMLLDDYVEKLLLEGQNPTASAFAAEDL